MKNKAKEYLKSIRNLEKDIEADFETIERLKAREGKCTSELTDMPRGGGVHDKMSITDKRIDLESEIRRGQLTHYSMIFRAERMIATLKRPEQRAILKQYYINGKTWEETAVLVGYSWKHMHRMHRDALNEFETKMTLNDTE